MLLGSRGTLLRGGHRISSKPAPVLGHIAEVSRYCCYERVCTVQRLGAHRLLGGPRRRYVCVCEQVLNGHGLHGIAKSIVQAAWHCADARY